MRLEDTLKAAQKLAQGGDWEKALRTLNTVLPEDAYRPDFKIFRARILLAMQRTMDALSDIDDADGGVASPRLLALRAEVEERLGRIDAAIHTLSRALSSGADASLLARRAVLLQGTGDFGAARADLLAAIEIRPNEGDLYRLFAGLHKFTKTDPMLAQMRAEFGKLRKASSERVGFEFALAKASDDCGDYDTALGHLKRGNTAMRGLFPYDIQTRLTMVEAYQKQFETFSSSDYIAQDASDYDPIFITGMPRSGTTLVEQIISSHAHVQSGGETARFLPRMLETIGDPTSDAFEMSRHKIAVLGQRYHADMLSNLHIAKRHTDKSIQTISYAGPVIAALPKAKIIVVTRNPDATALSLYKHVFRPGKQLFSYNMADIRAYQASFDRMVAFWVERLPGSVLQVAYEDVVTNTEPTIRRMLDFVGLAWDQSCAHPEHNRSTVRTLSSVAVRKPIGLHARDHWKNYARHLNGPPKNAGIGAQQSF